MGATALSTDRFTSEVEQSSIPVMLDFWAQWCGPCKAIGPSVEALAEEYAGRAKIMKVDVDVEGDLAARFGVMSIPALVFFKGGREVGRIVGARPKEAIAAELEKHL